MIKALTLIFVSFMIVLYGCSLFLLDSEGRGSPSDAGTDSSSDQ